MINVDEIQKAIAAHAGSKARLHSAADRGEFDVSTETVKADDQCLFGKWLYGSEVSAAEKTTDYYLTVKELHARFHRDAAAVVELARCGQRDEAEKALSMGSNYVKSSTALTGAMVQWRASLH